MHPAIAEQVPRISDLCRQHHVRRLEVFGSAARGSDFDLGRSDVDFLVEFDPDPALNRFEIYFALKQSLEELLHRDVDLVTLGAVVNPYVLASIDRSRELVHGA